jgi:regulator of replication initiation timing
MDDLEARARPHAVINWALRQYIDVPPELINLALARGMSIRGHKTELQICKERHEAEMADAQRKTSALAKHNDSLLAENDELRAKLEQLSAALADEQAKTEALAKSAASVPAEENENTAALSRKYNKTATLLYALSVAHHDIHFGGMHKPDLGPVLNAIERGGLKVNRATLAGHLLHGAQEMSK